VYRYLANDHTWIKKQKTNYIITQYRYGISWDYTKIQSYGTNHPVRVPVIKIVVFATSRQKLETNNRLKLFQTPNQKKFFYRNESVI
jgi:hypothetical protein